MMKWIIAAIALAAIAKLWMVENRVIALERTVDQVANLSLATGESVNKMLAEELQRLKEAQQMQVEVYEEPEQEPVGWLQL